MEADIAYLKSIGAEDIRINQQQVNAAGNRVGTSRPDVQATIEGNVNGRRITIEYDTNASSRGLDHGSRTLSNDPTAIIILKRVN